jgi:hypothetical protein
MDIETWSWRNGYIIGALAIFLYLFTVCSSCKRKFSCPFVDKKKEVIRLETD